MISTRRSDGPTSIHTSLSQGRNFYDPNKDNFSEAINLAQINCLDGNDFSTQMVKISICSQPHDLTFIDLPGLTARDVRNPDAQQNRVYDILEFIKNDYKKSIIFHIIDANSELEKSFSIIELDEIIKSDRNRQIINIYTKTDKLENENSNRFSELDAKIIGKKFIMNGIEDSKEKMLGNYSYPVGIVSVLKYLDQVNQVNIEQNYRLFLDRIKQKFENLDKKLKNELRPFDEWRERNKIIKETKKALERDSAAYFKKYKSKKESIFKDLKKTKSI